MTAIISLLLALFAVKCSEIAYIQNLFDVDPDASIAQIRSRIYLCQTKACIPLIPMVVRHGDIEVLEHVGEKVWKKLVKSPTLEDFLWSCPEGIRGEVSIQADCVARGLSSPSELLDVFKKAKPIPAHTVSVSAVIDPIDLNSLDKDTLMSLKCCCRDLQSALKVHTQQKFLACDLTTNYQWRLSFLKLYKLYRKSRSTDKTFYTQLSTHPVFQHYSHILLHSEKAIKVKKLPQVVKQKLKYDPGLFSTVPVIELLQRGLHPDLAYALVDSQPDRFLQRWSVNTEKSSLRFLRPLPGYILGHQIMKLIAKKASVRLIDIKESSKLLELGLPWSINQEISMRISRVQPPRCRFTVVCSMSSKASKLKLRAEFPPLVDIVPKTPKKQKKLCQNPQPSTLSFGMSGIKRLS